jgi:hypothetical protein
MDVKQSPPKAVKSDGTFVPQEPGLGAKLAVAQYYFDCAYPDATTESVHVVWDATFAGAITIQDSNLPAYKSANAFVSDVDSGIDVSIFDGNAGNWITENPSTAYVPVSGGATVSNMTVTVTAGPNGAMFNLGNMGSRRVRLSVNCTTGGYLRVAPHGKS